MRAIARRRSLACLLCLEGVYEDSLTGARHAVSTLAREPDVIFGIVGPDLFLAVSADADDSSGVQLVHDERTKLALEFRKGVRALKVSTGLAAVLDLLLDALPGLATLFAHHGIVRLCARVLVGFAGFNQGLGDDLG